MYKYIVYFDTLQFERNRMLNASLEIEWDVYVCVVCVCFCFSSYIAYVNEFI